MNKIIAIIALFAATTASAYTADTAWTTLQNDPRIQIDAPTVFMGHAIDYTFTCVDGANLRTVKPVKQCETIYIGQNQSKEVCKGANYLSTPINYTRTSWDCKYVGGGSNGKQVCEDKVISGTYALTVNAKVSKVMGGKNDRVEFLFNKAFTVPNCQ